MPIPSRADRAYEVVVYGATGFTGQLVADYLAGGRATGSGHPPLAWAIAGRDAAKLAQVKAGLTIHTTFAQSPDIIVANANDQQSMQKMTAATRVVISTVGPFTQYGEPLIAACVKTGTDYVDSTGESIWVSHMIDKYADQAEQNGSILSSLCGFDAIPADLGAYLVADELKTKHNTLVAHMQGFTRVKGGGVSGGTIASMPYILTPPKQDEHMKDDVYMLNPTDLKPTAPRAVERDQIWPQWDDTIERWTTPWLMAIVNTRVVRRSIALRRQLDKKGVGDGDQASYNESIAQASAFAAFTQWIVFFLTSALLSFGPTQRLLTRFVLPKPGAGPSAASRGKTTFSHRVIGTGENGVRVQSIISGGDPGYTETAKFLGESALLLAQDRDRLELNDLVVAKGAGGRVGGFMTPSVMGGQILAERLRGAGLVVTVEEFKG